MTTIQGASGTPLPLSTGASGAGQVHPRLAGIVRHAAIATPRLAVGQPAPPPLSEKPLDARRASVVPPGP